MASTNLRLCSKGFLSSCRKQMCRQTTKQLKAYPAILCPPCGRVGSTLLEPMMLGRMIKS
eukprot:3255151-Amphidinium_carterae.1